MLVPMLVLLGAGSGGKTAEPAAGKGSEKNDTPGLIRSSRSGPWSAAATWEGGKVPAAGARVRHHRGAGAGGGQGDGARHYVG
jgi:hypothetical protein